MLEKTAGKKITVALAGPPNVGKSTIFNLLTGLSQHVGNWPGKTVEQKTGSLRWGGMNMNIIDLPGTYSLTANSAEEQIARDFLVQDKPDVVVAVLNTASLERNLYLVAELIELAPRLIVALNMMDVAKQQGMQVDTAALSRALNVPVIPIVASKNQGLDDLLRALTDEVAHPPYWRNLKHIEYSSDIERVIDRVASLLGNTDTGPYPRHWAAMKLLEGDRQIAHLIRGHMQTEEAARLESCLLENESAAVTIASLRYEWVSRMIGSALKKRHLGQVSLSEKIDRAAIHPLFGMLILVGVLGIIFAFVYSLGVPIQNFLEENLVQRGQDFISGLGFLPPWAAGFINGGLLSGVGTVLTFLPILFFFFIAWAFMEDVGYTARAAFVTDRFMHLLGLHGKSCLPLVLGFGCNVPAVLGTRIIDSKRARLLTILLAPLVPCTGRMAVIAVIAAAFFGSQAIFISIGIILFSLLMLILVGLILNRFIIRGESGALLMELPLYHIPNPKLILMVTWHSLLAFIKRAGTLILIVSVAVWLLSVIPDGNIGNSLLTQIGRWLEPAGRLLGLGWEMMVALLSSFIAKENTMATLGVLLGGQGLGFTQQLRTMLSPASALAFLVMQVLFIPCVATVAAMRQETGGWRWPLFIILLQLVISYGMAMLVYRLALLFI
ncbi:MAG TPA: ferrous iron transport protein B [Dehalococcoidia bacterium]|nr:ferrous iron transport protein B [Dehalococcoidia bacterium]